MTVEKIRGSENPADMLTKEVTIEKLKLCKALVGLQGQKTSEMPFVSKREIVN